MYDLSKGIGQHTDASRFIDGVSFGILPVEVNKQNGIRGIGCYNVLPGFYETQHAADYQKYQQQGNVFF